MNVFDMFRKKRTRKYVKDAFVYIGLKYVTPVPSGGIRFSLSEDPSVNKKPNEDESVALSIKNSVRDNDIRYSDRVTCDDIRYSRRNTSTPEDT